MTTSGSPLGPRSRRAIIAAAGGLGLVIAIAGVSQTETVAAFADSVWSGGTFNLAETVDLVSSRERDRGFDDHDGEHALEMFSTPLSLVPGQTEYAHFYIRTTGISTAAAVSMAPAGNAPAPGTPESALWTNYVKFGARTVDASQASDDPVCSEVFDANPPGAELVPSGSDLESPPTPASDFDLAAAGDSTTKVCFEFSLLGTAVTANPSVNGTTIKPTWAFTGEASAP